jgi:hypothetical protein
MKKILYLLLILSASLLYSQRELNSKDIDKFCYKFKIENEKIVGKGSEILNDIISQSQFVLLGEQHFASEISLFTNSLIPILSNNNFKFFVAEIGPNSSKKLISEIQNKGQLFDFNTKYNDLTGEIPIPFFDGKEDEIFLKNALKNNFQILGIDQEYLTAQFFLFDEILELSKNRKNILAACENATKFMLAEVKEYWKDSKHKIFEKYINSKEINTFFELTDKKNVAVQKIISDLKISWNIYMQNEKGFYKNGWIQRIQNMKTNFSKYYKSATKKDDLPKMFVKMGAVHLSNGMNNFGYYDLGNLIKELSHFNQTKSTSIKCMPRFYMEDNQVKDDLTEENPINIILEKGNKDEWTLIDNGELLNYCYTEKIKLNPELKTEIERFDFILIPPLVNPMKMNFKK